MVKVADMRPIWVPVHRIIMVESDGNKSKVLLEGDLTLWSDLSGEEIIRRINDLQDEQLRCSNKTL